jgi:hypothetical protein
VRSWIKKLNHPVVPVLLLLLVWIEWFTSQPQLMRDEETACVRVRGPEIALDRASSGTWKIEWPAWDARKGDPILIAEGLPIRFPPAPDAITILLRVHPPDAVRLARDRTFDSEGWFRVWVPYDYATVAYLDPSNVEAVEYRIDSPLAEQGSTAFLKIEGSEDPDLLEGVLIRRAFDLVLAVIVSIPLLVWLVFASIRWWKARSVLSART